MKNPLQYIARAAASLFHKIKAKITTNKVEVIMVSDPFTPSLDEVAPTRAELRARWRSSHGRPGDKLNRLFSQKRATIRNITHAY